MTTLDIFADPVCPWCLIGLARLDRALAARPDHGLVAAYHPYQLNPTLPPQGMARAAYLLAKFGREGAVKVHLPVLEAAEELGLALDLAAITRQPNTRDAHRLMVWAGVEGRQSAVMAALMAAYWTQGRDIGRAEVLTEIAEACGMDGALVARLLASAADIDTVTTRDAHARSRGVRAVPSFVLGDRHVIEGAQPADLWLRVIDELAGLDPEATRH